MRSRLMSRFFSRASKASLYSMSFSVHSGGEQEPYHSLPFLHSLRSPASGILDRFSAASTTCHHPLLYNHPGASVFECSGEPSLQPSQYDEIDSLYDTSLVVFKEDAQKFPLLCEDNNPVSTIRTTSGTNPQKQIPLVAILHNQQRIKSDVETGDRNEIAKPYLIGQLVLPAG